MIPKIQKDFLLLFQCIIDFGAEVLRDFTEEKIKMKYKTDDFTTFLENTKHYFYHQWDKKKVACCECPAHGCSIPKTGKMDKKIYDKLYLYNTSMKCPKGHEKKGGSSVIQTCICRYTAKHILINALDLSDLNALLIGLHSINSPMICQSEAVLINEIMIVRGTVCHAVTTATFSEPELISLWAKFTNALYNLCPGDSKNIKWLKKTIETTKKTILSEEEIQELMGTIVMLEKDYLDISEEVKKIVIDKTAELKNCVMIESAGIKAHFDSTLQPFTDKQERHSELLLDKMEKFEEKMIGRLEQLLGSHPVFAGACLPDVRTEPVIERADQRKIAIKGKITQASMTKTNEDNVIRTLPTEIDVTYEDNEQPNIKRQIMHVKATRANSIELELDVTTGIFENAQAMRVAILTLVKAVVVAAKADADATKEDPIHILLTFESPLTEDETATVIDFFMNTHQNGNESQGDILKTIDASSCDSSFSNAEVGNAEISFTKDPTESMFSKKNETINYLEKLQGLEKKAEEVARLLLEKHVTRGKNISSLLMRHKHSIYHLYERNPCCQCSAVIPGDSGVRRLRQNEFEGMFAKKKVECQYRQKESTCICFWNARKDVNEICLPFPVIIYLLDYSSVTHNYERQLKRMKSTLVQINKLGQRLELIDFYKIWKSLGDDILYMANAISTQYRKAIDTDIQSFRPNLSTFELSVLDFMNEMNITITDGLSNFQTEMKILRKDMEAHIFERNLPVRDVPTNASLVQELKINLENQILDFRRYISTEIQDLKADIGSVRKIEDPKELADTQKPMTKILMEKPEELQYEKKYYKSPFVSIDAYEPMKERQLLKTLASKHWHIDRKTEIEMKERQLLKTAASKHWQSERTTAIESSPPHKMALHIASPHSLDKDEMVERFETLKYEQITVKLDTEG